MPTAMLSDLPKLKAFPLLRIPSGSSSFWHQLVLLWFQPVTELDRFKWVAFVPVDY